MVFESILDPVKAEHSPIDNFFLGILYTSIAILLTIWIFKGQGSLIMVTILVLASMLLMFNVTRLEEQKDKDLIKEGSMLKEHSRAISFFAFLFLGYIVAFSVWFTFLPYQQSQDLFSLQLDTIKSINAPITGNFLANMLNPSISQITGNFLSDIQDVNKIFYANISVSLFSILFSFFFGAGAIFILAWNASVIGTAIGLFIRNNIGVYASKLGFASISNYMQTFSIGLLRYAIHGIPEVVSYFVASLSGGILSIAIMKHDLADKNFKKIMLDVISLFVLSLVILYLAAIIEVYISPTIS